MFLFIVLLFNCALH
ncbi:hypothetical protein [Clostridium taeniosporum]